MAERAKYERLILKNKGKQVQLPLGSIVNELTLILGEKYLEDYQLVLKTNVPHD